MDASIGLSSQLSILEASLVSGAKTRAEERLGSARRQASTIRKQGETRCRALLDRARAEGERAAEREGQRRLVHARREARQQILRARLEAYERLTASVVSAVQELRQRPDYAALEQRLVALAKELLGSDAEIRRDPEGRGGVSARKGSRSLDLSLPALARRCVEEERERVSRLWR